MKYSIKKNIVIYTSKKIHYCM